MNNAAAYAAIFQWVGILLILVVYLACQQWTQYRDKKSRDKKHAEFLEMVAREGPKQAAEQFEWYRQQIGAKP